MTKNALATKRSTKRQPKRASQRKAQAALGPPEVPPGHRDGHISVAVRGCACLQCRVHRASWHRRMADHVLARLWDARYPHGSGGRVRVGANATAEFRDIMTGERT